MESPHCPSEDESSNGPFSPFSFLEEPFSPLLEMENKSSQSTYEENKMAEINPPSPDFFEKIAAKIPSKSIQQMKNHYHASDEDVEMIELGSFLILDDTNHDSVDEKEKENDQMETKEKEGSTSGVTKRRKNGGHGQREGRWTEEEHRSFRNGLEIFGKDWKSISELVGTRTPRQVASHAQKYLQRQTSSTRRRRSINDIATLIPTTSIPPLPQIGYGTPGLSFNSIFNQSFNGENHVQQNPNFHLPMNHNFAPAEGSTFNQSSSRDFMASFLPPPPRNQQSG